MVTRLSDRRSVLAAAGLAALATVAAAAPAQAADIRGTIAFGGGEAIPKGELRIFLEVSGVDAPQPAAVEVATDGSATEVEFSITPQAPASAAPGSRIVARLERQDGWLLALGSAQLETDLPVRIVLHTVMY